MSTRNGSLSIGLLTAFTLTVSWSPLQAENIDPLDNGSQYAWGENVGWINAEPAGNGGPGMQLGDFHVSGWLWGENIGWISLTCENTGSCESMPYGVRHDGTGALFGMAWAENAGWIDFGTGVFVDPSTGELSGYAWGENIGWISFRSNGANPHVVTTSWICDPPPPGPIDPPHLMLSKAGPTVAELFWDPIPGATGYDAVIGELHALRNDPNRFATATLGCIGDNMTGIAAAFDGNPPPGDGFWFLVRGANCGGVGTYDSFGPGLAAPRDPDIAVSTADCIVP